MPYVDDWTRRGLRSGTLIPTEPGHLNYLFSETIVSYLYNNGESYQTYNDIIGALEACKLELYRRKVVDYEDQKIIEHGDVY